VPPTPDPASRDGGRAGRDVARTRGPLLVAAVLVVVVAGLVQRDTDRIAVAVVLLGVQLLGLLGLTLLAVDAATLRRAHHRERHQRDPIDRRP